MRRVRRSVLLVVLATLVGTPVRVQAAPPAEAATASPEAALEAGDLRRALELSTAAVESDPSPDNRLVHARVLDAMDDKAAAAAAYREWLEVAPQAAPEREPVRERLEALEEEARGKVEDEPASTHRAELDRERAKRQRKGALAPTPGPEPGPAPRDRVVGKWYFWVTLAAIGAAAGAIVGISIKAAEQERKDALDRSAAPPMQPGGLVLRF